MWFSKKKANGVEQPKEIKVVPVVTIKVINNSTDKEYSFNSESKYGLGWEYAGKILMLREYLSANKKSYKVIAHLRNFSMTEIKRGEEFSETETPEQTSTNK
jgi:hypothetical protein